MEENEKSWGIRGIPGDLRQAVINQAKRENIKVGEWLSLAIRDKIKADRNSSKELVSSVVSSIPVSSSLDNVKQVLDMIERLQNLGIEPSNKLQKQTDLLVRKFIRQMQPVQQKTDFVKQNGISVEQSEDEFLKGVERDLSNLYTWMPEQKKGVNLTKDDIEIMKIPINIRSRKLGLK
ncbi:hypothetical protein [Gluconobacter japonicus]|uniref:hypothetical protein n=1 Tax=Gluconobacter japonicus TaxID=376620 RepID=UPI001B8AB315|nr:hypothetical protein [Gluconobacter japonicus]MBS1051137.1 hypothetical protein [Gluconobacter japonicus]